MPQEIGTIATRISDPAAGLLLQFLAWVAARPQRSYAETMDAWRTSCPRLSVWEDALGEGLVQVDGNGAGAQSKARVSLTMAGQERLGRASAGVMAAAIPASTIGVGWLPHTR